MWLIQRDPHWRRREGLLGGQECARQGVWPQGAHPIGGIGILSPDHLCNREEEKEEEAAVTSQPPPVSISDSGSARTRQACTHTPLHTARLWEPLFVPDVKLG